MRLGSDFWPWIGFAVFPVTSFRASFGFRIVPWRVPRSVGPEHALDVQRAAPSHVDLARRSSGQSTGRFYASDHRRPVSRHSEATMFTGFAGRRKPHHVEAPSVVIDFST